MHYSAKAFTKNGLPTLMVKQEGVRVAQKHWRVTVVTYCGVNVVNYGPKVKSLWQIKISCNKNSFGTFLEPSLDCFVIQASFVCLSFTILLGCPALTETF